MISELITALAEEQSRGTAAKIKMMLLDSISDLLMKGLPSGELGSGYTIGAGDIVSMPIVADPDGKRMIKACAEPTLFERNYPGSINPAVAGRDLVAMALKVKRAEGILVCSATSYHSYPIYKADYPRLLERSAGETEKRCWRFWRRTWPAYRSWDAPAMVADSTP